MTHSLTLEVPENIYQPLAKEAEAKGRKVEEIALEKLAKDEPDKIDDPFEKFIGAFDSGAMDWANRHDEYLGEKLNA
ncbi:MAG: hypothetical protein H7070_06245 [Saprospiraceae bacterium]|nr:hypothetical protein [Pyrinomonadaceae bacterium]